MLRLRLFFVACVTLFSLVRSDTSSCNETEELRDSEVSKTFPTFPNANFSNPCLVKFAAQNDDRVQVTLPELKNLTSTQNDCSEQYVVLANEESELATAEKYCATKSAKPFVTRKNMVFLQYKIKDKATSFQAVLTPIKMATVCGSVPEKYDDRELSFEFPPPNQKVVEDMVCNYKISSGGSPLTAKITSINLGVDGECQDDYVVFGSESPLTVSKDYTKCGTKPPDDNYTTKGDSLYWQIKLKTITNATSLKVKITSGSSMMYANTVLIVGLFTIIFRNNK